MEMRRLVVEVDMSPESAAAVDWCAEHASNLDEVVAVVAMEPMGQLMLSFPPSELGYWREQVQDALDRHETESLRAHGVPYRTRIEDGTAWRALTRVAEAEHADAIVVGRRSDGMRSHLGLDEADRLVHHSAVPVIVIPYTEPALAAAS
jgi:nucleotide-binding universal stress UspA family protein